MRLFWVLGCLLAAFANAGEVAWQSNYSAALAKARQSNRLVMLFIYSDWCPYCRQLNKVVYPDPSVVEKSRLVVPVKVNGEEREAKPLQRKFGFLGYPTILFIDKNEQVQGKIPGFEGAETFGADIERFVASYKASDSMRARLAKNPRDSEGNTWMAALSAWRSDVNTAERHLATARAGTYRGLWYSRALCAIGDIHQMSNRVDRAIPLFVEAARYARDPHDLGYAKISIMFCYSMKDDKERMVAMAKDILGTPGIPAEYQESARSVLRKISLPN